MSTWLDGWKPESGGRVLLFTLHINTEWNTNHHQHQQEQPCSLRRHSQSEPETRKMFPFRCFSLVSFLFWSKQLHPLDQHNRNSCWWTVVEREIKSQAMGIIGIRFIIIIMCIYATWTTTTTTTTCKQKPNAYQPTNKWNTNKIRGEKRHH